MTQETTQHVGHTPGPWEMEWDNWMAMRGQAVAAPMGPDGSSLEEKIANIRLIAMAPDMLELLKAAMGSPWKSVLDTGWADAAQRVIAQAEGRAA